MISFLILPIIAMASSYIPMQVDEYEESTTQNLVFVSKPSELLSALSLNETDIELENDIDCSSINDELSKKSIIFDGILNGNFHSLSNLSETVVRTNNGTIKNIILDNSRDLTVNHPFVFENYGDITGIGDERNVTFANSGFAGNNSKSSLVGINQGNISFTYSSGDLSIIRNSDVNANYGRIAGDNSGEISYCYSSGNNDISCFGDSELSYFGISAGGA